MFPSERKNAFHGHGGLSHLLNVSLGFQVREPGSLEIATTVLKYSLNGNCQHSQLRLLPLLFRNIFLCLFLFIEDWKTVSPYVSG